MAVFFKIQSGYLAWSLETSFGPNCNLIISALISTSRCRITHHLLLGILRLSNPHLSDSMSLSVNLPIKTFNRYSAMAAAKTSKAIIERAAVTSFVMIASIAGIKNSKRKKAEA